MLVGVLFFALSGWGSRKGGRSYEVDFPDVTGIRVHSQVRYAGAPAGDVTSIRLLTTDERAAQSGARKDNAVRVTVRLGDAVPPIPQDTRITLSSDTLLSEKFVAFSAGSAAASKIAKGAVLQGMGATSLDALVEKIGPLVESLDPLLHSAEATFQQFNPLLHKTGDALDTFKDGIADVLPRISRLADSADGALKRIDRLIAEADAPIKADLEKLKVALEQLKDTMASADRFLAHTDKSMDARMAELGVVLENLKVATTYAKAAFKTLGEHPHRLIFGGKANELPSERDILKNKKPVLLKPKPPGQ